jgi:lysyl-tRNA synthetase class 2
MAAPTILYKYPTCMAAWAQISPDTPTYAERFEIYIAGVELANGFGELTDPAEQRERFVSEMNAKEAIYGERYPVDEAFIAALEQGLPKCSGIALGIDRLVMLATGAQHINDVLWHPVDL